MRVISHKKCPSELRLTHKTQWMEGISHSVCVSVYVCTCVCVWVCKCVWLDTTGPAFISRQGEIDRLVSSPFDPHRLSSRTCQNILVTSHHPVIPLSDLLTPHAVGECPDQSNLMEASPTVIGLFFHTAFNLERLEQEMTLPCSALRSCGRSSRTLPRSSSSCRRPCSWG